MGSAGGCCHRPAAVAGRPVLCGFFGFFGDGLSAPIVLASGGPSTHPRGQGYDRAGLTVWRVTHNCPAAFTKVRLDDSTPLSNSVSSHSEGSNETLKDRYHRYRVRK